MSMIKNRLEKNLKKLKPWAQRNKLEAYRLYDRDIPEYPYIVDIYKDHYLIYDKTDPVKDKDKNFLPEVQTAIAEIFKVGPDSIITKLRVRQEGVNQYEKLSESNKTFTVQENQAALKVNLYDYLDTGLFLDHRPMRQKIYSLAKDKKVLNLFCYTGSVSVFAALGGGTVTSVDMSQTYIEWAKENFALNNIPLSKHRFINENALSYLQNIPEEKFDVIFLDPPTFSNSKKMEGTFEVERDQDLLVNQCMKMLNPDGVLYFSNNKRKFKISEALTAKYLIKDISTFSIPQDFHDKKIHICFEIKNK